MWDRNKYHSIEAYLASPEYRFHTVKICLRRLFPGFMSQVWYSWHHISAAVNEVTEATLLWHTAQDTARNTNGDTYAIVCPLNVLRSAYKNLDDVVVLDGRIVLARTALGSSYIICGDGEMKDDDSWGNYLLDEADSSSNQ